MASLEPKPLNATDTESFAYTTVSKRLPAIIDKLTIDLQNDREYIVKKCGKAAKEELHKILDKLVNLKTEMVEDKQLTAFQTKSTSNDVTFWNDYVKQHPEATWYTGNWLYVECYMYRRIYELFDLSEHLNGYDYFEKQKQAALTGSMDAAKLLAAHLDNEVTAHSESKPSELKETFLQFLKMSLWGNKCDLSMSNGAENHQNLDPIKQMQQLGNYIVADDSSDLWEHILKLQSKATRRLDIVLDNSGYELFTDLCLAEFLLATKLITKVYFYPKAMPWFVSDTLKNDFTWVLKTLGSQSDKTISKLGKKWQGYMENGTWVLEDKKNVVFWTLPYAFNYMQKVDPDLYDHLSAADLILFKGDLNYRKLNGDLDWDRTTKFVDGLRGFTPAPLCSLRTIKADTVVGVSKQTLEKLDKEFAKKWMISGDYAVIQFC